MAAVAAPTPLLKVFLVAPSVSVAMAATDTLTWSSLDETWILVFLFMEVLRMTKILPYATVVATLFEISLKFLFKKATLSFAILLILIDISSPLRAAQGASNPAGFDIVGMKLGMSVAEIQAAIKAHNPSLPIDIRKQPINDQKLGVGKFMEILAAGPPYTGGLPAHEIISVAFTMTQPGRAFYIGRRAPFPPNQGPLVDKTVQQVREKYGPESHQSVNSAGATDVSWVFDKAGKQLFSTGPTDLGTCATVMGNLSNGNRSFSYEVSPNIGLNQPASYWRECGIHLWVGWIGSTDPKVLSVLDEWLVGDSIAVDDIQKLMAEVKTAQDLQRQQQEQKASGVKPVL
jgi:hypothetical protein